jgi:hypothetical protein
MLKLVAARAIEYSGDPGVATGMLAKDYRGKDAADAKVARDAAAKAKA